MVVGKTRKSNYLAVGLCLPHAALANLLSLSQSVSVPTCAHRPPTGEPDAGNPPVRFGGRGGLRAIPTPIQDATAKTARHDASEPVRVFSLSSPGGEGRGEEAVFSDSTVRWQEEDHTLKSGCMPGPARS